ncbi:bifunctional polysaccharide deacetylase/glycosyltransferase family 2 protein [Luedemannella flava]|uniref:bifunctional polysaccharide deacetylase/glycosyltransferase family 2 protein n=1 Tax=Luedemannella flava TaxID=349316 RepID=UPI0031E38423
MSTLSHPPAPPETVPAPTRPTWKRRMTPRPRWLLTSVVLGVFAMFLLLEAYVNAEFKPDGAVHESTVAATVPDSITGGGPLIDTTHGRVASYHMPPGTVALTFDDGPDPVWTTQVRKVLRKHGVPATFFVVGSQVARYPHLARELVADGNELGVHTFTHPDMTKLPAWQRTMEYSQTQMAIAAAVGVKTSLLRFPYSSSSDSLDDRTWPLVVEAGRQGYLTIETDTDSLDWERRGVDAIVDAATPRDGAGSVVLLHDAGGDRAETVAALDLLIPKLKAQGYEFLTVSEGMRRATATTAPVGEDAASALDQWRGRALVWAVQVADRLLNALGLMIITVGALTTLRTLFLFFFAGRHARRRRRPDWRWGAPVTEPVSVIVPAFNEKENIANTVRSLATGDYPAIEVIVVDDGSTDGTGDLVEALDLPNVRLVRVPNGGKPFALNVGVAWARHDLIIMVDGDTVFEPGSIRALVQPFGDPTVGAVAGNVKVSNRRTVVGRWQHIEYVIGFNLDRRLYEIFGCIPTVPGAIGAFRRRALRDVGGVSDRTLAEDTDLTMAITRAGWRVVYEGRARAWTEAPATLAQLWRQRYRWSYGTMQAMWRHRSSLVESGASGRFGRRGLPFLAFFGIALPLLAPLVDILTLYGFVFFNRTEAGVAWLAMLALQTVTAIVAFRLDGERLRPLWALPLQQFVYRQVIYVVMVQSALTALTGARLRWHKLRRTGEAAVGPTG